MPSQERHSNPKHTLSLTTGLMSSINDRSLALTKRQHVLHRRRGTNIAVLEADLIFFRLRRIVLRKSVGSLPAE